MERSNANDVRFASHREEPSANSDIAQCGRHLANVTNSEVVRFGVATLIHDVGASPQSHIGRSEN